MFLFKTFADVLSDTISVLLIFKSDNIFFISSASILINFLVSFSSSIFSFSLFFSSKAVASCFALVFCLNSLLASSTFFFKASSSAFACFLANFLSILFCSFSALCFSSFSFLIFSSFST